MPKGLERDTTVSQQGRTGRLEKHQAALTFQPGRMGYLLAELVVMPLVAMRASLSLRVQLPAPLFILGQSSWDGLRPSDYVLVLGDSYAQGNGDWLAEVDRSGNPPFHSTHLIHERTGRDVVSFGHSGAGSVAAMAYLVEKRFAALARMGFGRPEEVLVCF